MRKDVRGEYRSGRRKRETVEGKKTGERERRVRLWKARTQWKGKWRNERRRNGEVEPRV